MIQLRTSVEPLSSHANFCIFGPSTGALCQKKSFNLEASPRRSWRVMLLCLWLRSPDGRRALVVLPSLFNVAHSISGDPQPSVPLRSPRAVRIDARAVPSRHSCASPVIIACMYSANAIGMLCARSLHYQFYCWEAHQLVFLLWTARIPTSLRSANIRRDRQTANGRVGRILALLLIEICWETFPSTSVSSLSGLVGHSLVILVSMSRIPWATM